MTPGILRKVEYEGEWETFWAVAQATIKDGGGWAYNLDEKRGVIVVGDFSKKVAILIPSLLTT